MLLRKIATIVILFFVLTGCSSHTGHADFDQNIHEIEQKLIAEDWDALKYQLNELMKAYKKNDWKIQLIGDEGEYERLHESINRLLTAVDAKEKNEARIELATLKTIVDDIYSL